MDVKYWQVSNLPHAPFSTDCDETRKVVTDREVGDSDKEESAGYRATRTDEAGTDARP